MGCEEERNKRKNVEEELLAILDALKVNIYLTDLDTHEIIFMNDMMRSTYNLDSDHENLCYKAMHGSLTHQ